LIENIERKVNTIIKYKGLLVYSVTIVERAAKGLEMKFVIPYALPLTSTGNSNWFTWYPKF
jgi:hypothetical protein